LYFLETSDPPGWCPVFLRYQEGMPLALNLPAQSRSTHLQKLFTDTDMHDPTLKEEMEEFYHTLQGIVADNRLTLPSNDYDLVLDIMLINEDEIQWSYYYACHEIRCLFWLEPYNASYMISELAGVDCPAHVSASH
jgi:hypothetical protein